MIFARDNQSGMANIYGSTLATGGTVEDIQKWPDRIRAVTAKQVQDVAAQISQPGPLGRRISAAGCRSQEVRDRAMIMPSRSQLLTATATLFLALVFLTLPAIVAARAAVTIQEVVSEKGIKAWLVEDYSVPIISVRFAFGGGSTQDPAGKEGLANLMTGLFDEGADNLDSDAFQERLDDAGAEMGFNAGRDSLYGSMRMLADQKDEALELLRLAVEKPRFDQAPIDRIRAQIVAGITANAKDPQTTAQLAWAKALYGEHPYSRRDEGTEKTLASITTDDLHAFHKRLFSRGNLTMASSARSMRKRSSASSTRYSATCRKSPRWIRSTASSRSSIRRSGSTTICRNIAATCLSRHRAHRSAVLRGVPDESHPGRRHLHVATVRPGAREARSGLRHQLFDREQ